MLTQPSKLAELSLRYLLSLELKVGEVVNPKLVDNNLDTAASAEGLIIENPNNYT